MPGDRSHAACQVCTARGGKSRTRQHAPPASHVHLHASPLASSATPREHVCVHLLTRTHTHLLSQPTCTLGTWTSPGVQQGSARYTCPTGKPGWQELCSWGSHQIGEPVRGQGVFACNLHALTQPSHLCTEHFQANLLLLLLQSLVFLSTRLLTTHCQKVLCSETGQELTLSTGQATLGLSFSPE